MLLNIAVVNNSGNVGKSTICNVLLNKKIENSKIIKVETLNNDGTEDEKLSAKEFDDILKKLDENDLNIIDVGSSNIEQFLLQMGQFKGSHEMIDFFIIPVVNSMKQQRDSISTIESLLFMGIEKSKIKVVFNMAEKDVPMKKQFSEFLSDKECEDIVGKKLAVIYESNIFDILNKFGLTYDEVYSEERNIRELIRSAETKEERSQLSNLRTAKMLMNGFNDDLDMAFLNLELNV